ncbi:colanic acid exporter [Clostridium liquoris]|jgi:O-antigen/teichoic acid export membrane protein|uniref:Colanic acid exporter n=1 Tax=Clostridium liquoris TaxID=1289519 RepID=A0A2T0AZX0_9CLOT|nr:polysaccharide biosynthesis C-terminal domain-containing protein [Clostridium liquoris]PRR76807.1 colanic acid exporter [Clostridium liquoris]
MKESNTLKFAIKHGFIQIFSANFINKVIQFGITIVLTRILEKKVYGSFIYAQNILNMFLLLEGLGMVSGILQYCSMEDDKEKKLSYLKYALKVGILFNGLIAISIILFTLFFELPVKGSTEILGYFSLIPLLTIFFNEMQTFLRTELRNKEFSILSVTNTFLFFIGNLVLGILFNIKGIVIGRYLSYILSIFLGIYMLKDDLKRLVHIDYPKLAERKEFLKYSIVCCLTSSMSQLLYLMDTFLVGLIIKDQSIVASYKTATLVPFNLVFIPNSIIMFIYPYFAKKYDDKKWIKEKYNILQKYLFLFNAAITIFLIIFAPQVINILFTKSYADSLSTFRILMVGYFISGTFRIPSGNILSSMKEVKVNFYNSIISGVANILLDIALIKKMGSNGAAIATVAVYIISSLISNIYLHKKLK